MTTPESPLRLAGRLADRRQFLIGAGALAAGAALAACGNDDNDDNNSAADSTTTIAPDKTAAVPAADLDVAALAAGLEVLAVQTSTAALGAAKAGKLGEVPPAVATFVTTAMAQHQEHLDAWNKVLKSNDRPEVDQPDAKLKPTVDAGFAKVTTAKGAAELALQLEEIAAATYLDAVQKLTTDSAVELAGSIHVIDMQHSAILLYVLGKYPVPDVFGQTKKSAAA